MVTQVAEESTKCQSAGRLCMKIYGFADECQKFDERHPEWGSAMENLDHAVQMAFARVRMIDDPADKFVYFFGRVCFEDFMEIMLVCYHGYGFAASKLVRSMYEHAVTLCYLHEHPEELEDFNDYHLIQDDKLIGRLIETFGKSILPEKLVDETRTKAAAVREKFMITDCKTCDTKRLNHSWSKLDFVAMASAITQNRPLIIT